MKRAFTLIELLIVVAIIAIMTVAVGRLMSSTYRAAGAGHFEQIVFQEGRQVYAALVRDVTRAEASIAQFKDFASGENTLILKMANSTQNNAPEFVVYHVKDERPVRTVFRKGAANPVNHTLTELPGRMEFKRRENMMHVRVAVRGKKYREEFVFDEATEFYLPKRMEGSER